MKFHIYQHTLDHGSFVVTDARDVKSLPDVLCSSPKDELEEVGVFDEMGERRLAFDEGLAKRSIEQQGFYSFHSTTFDPTEIPISMP